MAVADLATRFQVTGEVCNVSDGSVELVAEGDAGELRIFHEAILERMSRNIIEHQTDWSQVTTPAHSGFSIAPDKLSR
jgi:acylphosphatase